MLGVLPLPVSAASTADAPSRNGCRATFWIGVGVWMLRFVKASCSDGREVWDLGAEGCCCGGPAAQGSARRRLQRSRGMAKEC